jgi:hypothetical protein
LQSQLLAITDVETRPKLWEHRGWEALSEYVSELGGGQDTKDANISDSDVLTNKVEVDLHVLRALMLHEIGGEVDRADIVVVDEGGASEGRGQSPE